jgi:hypothetical protein
MRVWAVIVTIVFMSAGSAQAAAPKKAIHRPVLSSAVTLLSYSGEINAQAFDKFTEIISANTDKVIELKVTVERSKKSQDRYYVSLGDDQLTISGGDPMDSPREVVINGPVGTTVDMLKIDGFYLVKDGGMHAAGALSWGLVPVDEATIRLNPKIRIAKREF